VFTRGRNIPCWCLDRSGEVRAMGASSAVRIRRSAESGGGRYSSSGVCRDAAGQPGICASGIKTIGGRR